MMRENLLNKLDNISGKVSFFYKNLVTEEELTYQIDQPLQAASVIKIPIMVEAFFQVKEGKISLDDEYVLREEDKEPSCGCLNRMRQGLILKVEDLINLMIILSDNSASNILIRMLGRDNINKRMESLGYSAIRVNRLLFDFEAVRNGMENYVSVKEIADLLEGMYKGTLVDVDSSASMLDILKAQRLNGKIPFRFLEKIDIAHKTGEDSGITHDVGIVYGKVPYMVLFMGNEVDVPEFERFMQDTAYELYEYSGNKELSE